MTSLFLLIRSALQATELHLVRQPRRYALYALTLAGVVVLGAHLFLPPLNFPRGALLTIPEHASFKETADVLEEEKVIKSSFTLRVLARLSGNDRSINAGKYLFETPESVISVLLRLSQGEHGLPSVRVTFPEGISVREMGAIVTDYLSSFSEEEWLRAAAPYEGYLFPDTYNFYKDASLGEVIARMRENFTERTEGIRAQAQERSISFEDLVIMASLIEKEANTEEDRHIVSGILWSRIEEGVALQVDAVFPYIRENPDHVPNGDDPEMESPYNTYLNRGLPPGPIANPGLEALDSALNPTETDYFYYLTGKDGQMYYAEDFEGHKRNRVQYLD